MQDSFENTAEWTHNCHIFYAETSEITQRGNIFTPKDWMFWYKQDKNVPHDPENTVGWSQPEAHHLSNFDYRVQDGATSYLFFGFYRIMDAGLYRQLSGNGTITVSYQAHAWSNADKTSHTDDAHWSEGVGYNSYNSVTAPDDATKNFTFYIGVDPTGGKNPYASTVVWSQGQHIYNTFAPVSLTTTVNGTFTVFIRAKTLWAYKHNDAYIDNFQYTTEETRPPYARTYVLLPQNASLAWLKEVVTPYYSQRNTVGFSADDAGLSVSNLTSRKVIALWENWESWSSPAALADFFQRYYPGVELEQHLPPGGTKNLMGLHYQPSGVTGVKEYLRSKPTTLKSVLDTSIFVGLPKELIRVYRHYQPDQYFSWEDTLAAARKWRDCFLPALSNVDLSYPLYVESINEVYDQNPVNIQQAVRWDISFIQAIKETGLNLIPVVFTAAVGNPDVTPAQMDLLLPLVRSVVTNNAVLGEHCYWGDHPDYPHLFTETWNYLGGRFAMFDAYFAKYNLAPKWLLTEAGLCKAQVENGNFTGLLPNDGWKSIGTIDHYLQRIKWANAWYNQWNETHNQRLLGVNLFTTGGWNWDSFNLADKDLIYIGNNL